ncbi:MAG: Flp family type IVb pilin [Eubacterium sp.]|nr:Flp family type IVb pilin [Eubacterium sp.]
MREFNGFFIDESGQGMVEYSLIIGLIAVALIAAVVLLKNKLFSSFTNSANNLP